MLTYEAIRAVSTDRLAERRVTNTAHLFRLASEEVITHLRAGTLTKKALCWFGDITLPLGETVGAFAEDGAFIKFTKGENAGEYLGELYTRCRGKESKRLKGGFSLFNDDDITALDAVITDCELF